MSSRPNRPHRQLSSTARGPVCAPRSRLERRMLAGLAGCLLGGLVVSPVRGDLNLSNLDRTSKPQINFYDYAVDGWKKTHPIPAAYSTWGAFNEVIDRNEAILHRILDREAAAVHPDPIGALVGNLYSSGMNLAAIDAAGIAPIRADLQRIDGMHSASEVIDMVAWFHKHSLEAFFALGSEQDPKDSERMIAGESQAGLGMPDRDYYFRDDARSKELRSHYVAHVARMLALIGDDPEHAKAEADIVMRLETAMAKASRSAADLRDPVANYHKLPLAEVRKLTPHFDWTAYLAGIGLPTPEAIDVSQPEFMEALDGLLASASVDDWKAYFRWHLIHDCAPYLSKPVVDENFAFFGKELTGVEVLRDRWRRVLNTVDSCVGEALGQLYVADNFPPESKRRMLQLVNNLKDALRARLLTLEWMDAPTRTAALAKLDAFGVKIGYPDRWIDYSSLTMDRGPYVLNVLRANAFNVRRDLAKIGKPVDRLEWGMTPPTVNAYYNPSMNEVVFPAGILQPPFFDAKADDAVNYGSIGAAIGHEMTHGFDDEGRQFDAHGNLSDWWTPASAVKFKERSAAIVRQFNSYAAIGEIHVNGELTQGENIADLGGIKLAYAALEHALEGQSRARIDGFTPEQRFFLSFASVWRQNQRLEAERLQVNTDPHSPAAYRVNGPLSNLPEFAAAFDVPEGSPMRRAAKDRVEIW